MERNVSGLEQGLAGNPEMYDAAFGYRNIAREVDFMEAAYRRFVGPQLGSVLDLGCGTGTHAIELARRGFRVCGIDKSESMLEHARAKAAQGQASVDFRLLDMGGFHLDDQFDCAICMLHSLAYLTTNKELFQHFACVSRCLSERGMYLIELGNPRTWFADPPRSRRERWDKGSWSETRDGMRIRAALYRDPVDFVSETARVELVIDITGRGISHRITDGSLQRLLLPQGLCALAAAGRFKLAGYFGDFTLDQPLDDSTRSWRMIGVFVRTGKPSRAGESDDGQTQLPC